MSAFDRYSPSDSTTSKSSWWMTAARTEAQKLPALGQQQITAFDSYSSQTKDLEQRETQG